MYTQGDAVEWLVCPGNLGFSQPRPSSPQQFVSANPMPCRKEPAPCTNRNTRTCTMSVSFFFCTNGVCENARQRKLTFLMGHWLLLRWIWNLRLGSILTRLLYVSEAGTIFLCDCEMGLSEQWLKSESMLRESYLVVVAVVFFVSMICDKQSPLICNLQKKLRNEMAEKPKCVATKIHFFWGEFEAQTKQEAEPKREKRNWDQFVEDSEVWSNPHLERWMWK